MDCWVRVGRGAGPQPGGGWTTQGVCEGGTGTAAATAAVPGEPCQAHAAAPGEPCQAHAAAPGEPYRACAQAAAQAHRAMGLLRVHSDQRPASEHVPCMRDGRAATAVHRSAGRTQAGPFVRSSFRASQELSRPLRRLLQATGAVLLRLGGRRGDLWLRAHGSAVLSAGVPPHGLVPAAGVRSKGGR